MSESENDSADAAGSPALEGWLYQCDVSVWVALDLMLVHNAAEAVQLEPATFEDVEVELADAQPKAKFEVASAAGELLVIQAKHRTGGHWTEPAMKKLAAHGTVRQPINERLKDPRVKYVLVTSNGVNGKLRDLEVNKFREQTEVTTLPATVFAADVLHAAAKRFVILSKQTPERVLERIEALLVESLRVPLATRADCVERLRAEAIERMRKGHAWLRPDLIAVVKKFGGADPHARATGFVKPTNWDQFVGLLIRKKAVVIAGPSGTGKTTLAHALSAHMAKQFPGLEIVHVKNEPAKLEKRLEDPTPVIFHVEDPWGTYDSTDDQLAWSTHFKGLLLSASPSRLYVVTTRTDVLADAKGNWDFLNQWKVSLTEDDYGSSELRKIFDIGLSGLESGGLKSAAIDARDQVLLKLTTPFEIDRFFKLLGQGPLPQDRTDKEFVHRVLNATQTDSIEEEVKTLVLQRKAGDWAAVVWALMRALPTVTGSQLTAIQRAMYQRRTLPNGSDTLLDVLLGAGYVKFTDDRYSFSHPKAEQGVKLAALKRPFDTEATLSDLVDALLTMSEHSTWAVPAASRIHARRRELVAAVDELSDEQQAVIDAWIDRTLAVELHDYAAVVRLASEVGSANSIGAEVARWLQTTETGGDSFMSHWSRPPRDESWYPRIQAHPLTAKVLRQYIRTGLSTEARYFPTNFADEMDVLATDLDGAWRERVFTSIPGSHGPNVDVVAYGAMRNPLHREELLAHALANNDVSSHEESDDEYWASRDGHNDEFDSYDGGGDEDNVYLLFEAYAAAVRKDDWRLLANHPQVELLVRYWARAARTVPDSDISDDEILALIQAASKAGYEASTWNDLSRRAWRPVAEKLLTQRLIDGTSSAQGAMTIAESALSVAAHVLTDAMRALIESDRLGRALDLAREAIVVDRHDRLKMAQIRALKRCSRQLPAPFQELASAVVPRLERKNARPLSPAAAEAALRALPSTSQLTRIALISHLAVNHPNAHSLARDLIFECVDPEPAELGVRLAAKCGWWPLVEESLAHPRADVRQRAYESLIDAQVVDRAALNLRMASDPGSRVRRAVVAKIKRSPSAQDVPALLRLVRDKWRTDEHPYSDYDIFPIAREAAKCLAAAGTIPEGELDDLFAIARTTKDAILQEALLKALADAGGDTSLRRIARRVTMQKETRLELSAAKALAFTERSGILDELGQLPDDYLIKVRPVFAPFLALAIGRHGTVPAFNQIADLLASAIDYRVLLLPLAFGAAVSREALAREALDRLPPAHLARTIFEVPDGEELPEDVLDDLGDIHVVKRVLDVIPKIAERSRLTKEHSAGSSD